MEYKITQKCYKVQSLVKFKSTVFKICQILKPWANCNDGFGAFLYILAHQVNCFIQI